MPPVTVTYAAPEFPPKHDTFFCTPGDTEKPEEEMTLADVAKVQPFESLTVTLYVPTARLIAESTMLTFGDHV